MRLPILMHNPSHTKRQAESQLRDPANLSIYKNKKVSYFCEFYLEPVY